jgi:hypothetical protein
MLVFLRLCRTKFETYWMPHLYGERGRPVLDAFDSLQKDLDGIAAVVLTHPQRVQLDGLVNQWLRDNPDQYRVESVRLMDFSQRAGQVEAQRAKETGGLLASVKGATQAADQAVLIAERGVFLAQRMPFLIRFQARLGARELVNDAFARMGSPSSEMLAQFHDLQPAVKDLVVQSGNAAHEARLLARDIKPLVPSAQELRKIDDTIGRANDLTVHANQLVGQVRELTPKDSKGTFELARRGVDDAMKRGLVYLTLLGLAWSAVWWGGYYVVKRQLARH